MTDIKFTSENLTCEGHRFKSQSGPSIFLPSHYHVTFGAYDQPLELTGLFLPGREPGDIFPLLKESVTVTDWFK